MAKIDKLLEQAQPHLNSGERVAAAVQGTYEVKIMGSDSVRSGVLMATDTRIVFYAKKLGGYDLESFGYGNISSFEQSKNMMGHAISFFASGNKVNMKWISDAAAMQEFVTAVRQRMNNGPSASTPAGSNARDLAAMPPPVGTPHLGGSSRPDTQPSTERATREASSDDKASILESIQKLGELHQAGILSDEEFSAKKADLLARL